MASETGTITELREQRRWRAIELASRIGAEERLIHYWEQGRGSPNLGQLRRLADAFAVTMESIALPAQRRVIKVGGHYFELAVEGRTEDESGWRARVRGWDATVARDWPVRPVDENDPDTASPSSIAGQWEMIGGTPQEALDALEQRVTAAMERALHRGPLPGDPPEWQPPAIPEHWRQHLAAMPENERRRRRMSQ